MKKVLVITASPRVGGNSDRLADAFMKGAKSAGNLAEKLELRPLRINPCVACDKCFSGGKPCVQDDDMDRVYQAVEDNDIIVFAMPLYYYSIPANLKAVIDRLYALYVRGGYPKRRAVVLVAAGDSAQDTFHAVDVSWRKILSHLEWPLLGTVYAGSVLECGAVDKTEYPAAAEKLGASIRD
jgi:multimeric flavodoxin WrbA